MPSKAMIAKQIQILQKTNPNLPMFIGTAYAANNSDDGNLTNQIL